MSDNREAALQGAVKSVELTPIHLFQLFQWKAAIQLEAKGMRHSSGRSVRKHACQKLGLPIDLDHDSVIEAIWKEIRKREEESR